MKMFQVPEGTTGIVVQLATGKQKEWSTRQALTFTGDDLMFDRIRMHNKQVLKADWGTMYSQVERWCEQTYMGFLRKGYLLVIKENQVATFA